MNIRTLFISLVTLLLLYITLDLPNVIALSVAAVYLTFIVALIVFLKATERIPYKFDPYYGISISRKAELLLNCLTTFDDDTFVEYDIELEPIYLPQGLVRRSGKVSQRIANRDPIKVVCGGFFTTGDTLWLRFNLELSEYHGFTITPNLEGVDVPFSRHPTITDSGDIWIPLIRATIDVLEDPSMESYVGFANEELKGMRGSICYSNPR